MQKSIWASDNVGGPAARPPASRPSTASVLPAGPVGGPGAQAMRAWLDADTSSGQHRFEATENRPSRERVTDTPKHDGLPKLFQPDNIAVSVIDEALRRASLTNHDRRLVPSAMRSEAVSGLARSPQLPRGRQL